jgi:hypothetical protein
MFQSTVRELLANGVVGELAFEGPLRAQPANLNSASAANNVIGRAFTFTEQGVAAAGGTGAFAGILANPKAYALQGTTAGGSLAPTLALPNGAIGEFVTMGIMYVTLPAVADIGALVIYATATGILSTVPAGTTDAGVGNAFVPNAVVSHYDVTAAGLAVITLTN